MNVILKRLIPEDDKHTIIDCKTQVEVIPDCLMTFKIPCHNKLSPCRFNFRYLSQSITQDLEVFVSLEEPVPSADKFDLRQSLPNYIIVNEDKNLRKFSGYNIYVSFYSLEGISLTVNPMFKEIKERVKTSYTRPAQRIDEAEELDIKP